MNTQSDGNGKNYRDAYFAAAVYLLVALAHFAALRAESNGMPLQLVGVTISVTLTTVIGMFIAVLIAASVRESGAHEDSGWVGWLLFVIPIVPTIVFVILAAPFFWVLIR